MCLQGGGRPESHHSRFLTLGLDVCLCADGRVGVLHAAGVFCLVIRSRASGRQAMTIQHTRIHSSSCLGAAVRAPEVGGQEEQASLAPRLLPRDKPPSFSRPPFVACAAVNHYMQAGELR